MSDAPHRRLPFARLDWRDGAPASRDFGDIYFSGDGAAEAAHVFLAGNDLERRFAEAGRFAIGELGFGTGLNFLLVWDLWRRTARPGARLSFLSVEGFPLAADDMTAAHRAWPELSDLSARLRALLPPPVAGTHAIDLAGDVTLTLLYGEAGAALSRAEAAIDAWFFDGFAPAKNPEMWRAELFAAAARLSAPGATFATFSVAGDVRRNLEAAGFVYEKRGGFGRKKDMLAGRIDAPPRRSKRAPWFATARPRTLAPCARVAIVGGGIAGASLAHAARRAGLAPVVIEKERPASGASGNPAGLIMPRLDLGDNPAARFFLLAYLHTIRLLMELRDGAPASALPGESRDPERAKDWTPAFAGASGRKEFYNPCGVLHAAADEESKERLARIAASGLLPSEWMRQVPEGLLFPQAGVVDPCAFVRLLIADAPVLRARARRLRRDSATIAVETDDGAMDAFDAVILANGMDALAFVEARGLPLSSVAGQIDLFPSAQAPSRALAFGPYAAPAPGSGLVIGATYDRISDRDALAASKRASEENLAAIRAFAPELVEGLGADASIPRASLRCQTPDRVPIAGPLPDLAYYGAEYDDLRVGKSRDYPLAQALDGVFALTGLGSRGLVTAPLAAAMIVAEMTGAPSPVDHEIAEALHPARFFIRDLKRARPVRPV